MLPQKNILTAQEAVKKVNEAIADVDTVGAYEWLHELVRISPNSTQAHTAAGLVALQLNRDTDAVTHFQRALEVSPDDYTANHNMAITEMRGGRYDLALKRLQHLKHLDNTNADIHNDIGVILQQSGREARALASFARAMKLAPDHSTARNNAMELCLTRDLTTQANRLLDSQARDDISEQARAEIDRWREVFDDPSRFAIEPELAGGPGTEQV